MSARPKLALALVVRDEERFLPEHLDYHAALGVERAFVYLDRCQDATPEIARAHPLACAIEAPRGADERYMSTYQRRCMADALERSRRDGFDWLLHLDPDEFAFGDARPLTARALGRRARGSPLRSGDLCAMLARVPERIEAVRLRTFEAVPVRGQGEGAPFTELVYFLTRGRISRRMLDPRDGTVRPFRGWLGGSKGKSIVRTDLPVEPASAHAWTREGGEPLRTLRRGWYFHFLVTSWRHWHEKYRKFTAFPARWEKGTEVGFPKQAWKDAAASMSEAEARAYFERWVGVDEERLRRWARRGRVRHDETVRRVLSEVGSVR